MTSRQQYFNQRRHIPPHLQEKLNRHMLEKQFRRGEVIADAALLRGYGFFLLRGMARGFYTRKGHDRTYSFAFEGDFFGVPMTLFRIPDATPAIEFLEASELIMIPHREMKSFMETVDNDTFREVADLIVSGLFSHVQEVEEQMFMFQSMNARERYEWFVGRYPSLLERATITQIASFLGVTKETLYRIRAGKYGNSSQIAARPETSGGDEILSTFENNNE